MSASQEETSSNSKGDDVNGTEEQSEVVDVEAVSGGEEELPDPSQEYVDDEEVETLRRVREKQKKKRVTTSKRAGLTFPVARIKKNLRKMGFDRVAPSAAVYLTAVCEYLVAEMLDVFNACAVELRKNRTHKSERHVLKPNILRLALNSDDDLKLLLDNVDFGETINVEPLSKPELKIIYNQEKLNKLRKRRQILEQRKKMSEQKEIEEGVEESHEEEDQEYQEEDAEKDEEEEPKKKTKKAPVKDKGKDKVAVKKSASPKRKTEAKKKTEAKPKKKKDTDNAEEKKDKSKGKRTGVGKEYEEFKKAKETKSKSKPKPEAGKRKREKKDESPAKKAKKEVKKAGVEKGK